MRTGGTGHRPPRAAGGHVRHPPPSSGLPYGRLRPQNEGGTGERPERPIECDSAPGYVWEFRLQVETGTPSKSSPSRRDFSHAPEGRGSEARPRAQGLSVGQ